MKIDKNIPLPGISPRSEVGRTVAKMKVGDSVFVEEYIKRQQLSNAIRARGWKSTARKYEAGHRVWRVA